VTAHECWWENPWSLGRKDIKRKQRKKNHAKCWQSRDTFWKKEKEKKDCVDGKGKILKTKGRGGGICSEVGSGGRGGLYSQKKLLKQKKKLIKNMIREKRKADLRKGGKKQ